jgi:hypothetical protein
MIETMRAIRLQTRVARDHTLHIELPADVEEGPAEVIVLVPEHSTALPLDALSREIDGLYDQIRTMVADRSGEPGLQESVRPLQQKLRDLQEREADAMERHFRRQRLFDPQQGRALLEQAHSILTKK